MRVNAGGPNFQREKQQVARWPETVLVEIDGSGDEAFMIVGGPLWVRQGDVQVKVDMPYSRRKLR